jgi:hypothetical protein
MFRLPHPPLKALLRRFDGNLAIAALVFAPVVIAVGLLTGPAPKHAPLLAAAPPSTAQPMALALRPAI